MTKLNTNAPRNFALMIETAAENFETLQSLVLGEIVVQPGQSTNFEIRFARANGVVQMALAKSFVFELRRAYRILEHGSAQIDMKRDNRKKFMRILKPIIAVRDVNEHGYDPATASQKKVSRPQLHEAEAGQALLDETSLIILGPEKILMGPLNLSELYKTVRQIRDIAGFATLKPEEN